MSKFKVGDKVRYIGKPYCGVFNGESQADHLVIREMNETEDYYFYNICDVNGKIINSCSGCKTSDRYGLIELVSNNEGDNKMAKRTFKQLKATPDVKKGAIWQEQCEDGTQPYACITTDEHFIGDGNLGVYSPRHLVEQQPQWFIEVFQVEPQYMTQAELDQFEAFKKAIAKKGKK